MSIQGEGVLSRGEFTRGEFETMCRPHEAIEFRVDLLASREECNVLEQLAILRRWARYPNHQRGGQYEYLPVVFTVRSVGQGGTFAGSEEEMFRLLSLGVRAGCEYIDVEACWSPSARSHLHAEAFRRGCRVIASLHSMDAPLSVHTDVAVRGFFLGCVDPPVGPTDIVKVVGRAGSIQCSSRIIDLARGLVADPTGPLAAYAGAVVAMCAGPCGALSRALCIDLGPVPVTHPALATKLGALGQVR